METGSEDATRRRAIALEEMTAEDALELLHAFGRSQPTLAAVALDHLMSGEDVAQPEE
jgi:hypothetical protein